MSLHSSPNSHCYRAINEMSVGTNVTHNVACLTVYLNSRRFLVWVSVTQIAYDYEDYVCTLKQIFCLALILCLENQDILSSLPEILANLEEFHVSIQSPIHHCETHFVEILEHASIEQEN